MAGRRKKKPSSEVFAYGQTWLDAGLANEEDLLEFEAVVGAKLPAALKTLMLTCGGASPSKNFHEGEQSEIFELGVGYILPLRGTNWIEGASIEITTYRDRHNLPADLVPFAYDSGHANLICLQRTTGHVIYWLHDAPQNRQRFLASSFEAFLENLSECPF